MREAILAGVNDYPRSPLYGCRNDVADWRDALTARGFTVTTLLDNQATKPAILGALEQMLTRLNRDGLGVFGWSGHGTKVADVDGDEFSDRLDEALVAYPGTSIGDMILDDELYRLFSAAEAKGIRTVALVDSCFSGSIGRLAPPLEATIAGVTDPGYARHARWLSPAEWGAPIDAMSRIWDRPRSKPRRSALTLSAARDDQVAYDAWLDGRYRGAFTAAALHALARVAGETPATNYRSWFRVIRQLLPSVDFEQQPQLDGSAAQRRWRLFDEHGSR